MSTFQPNRQSADPRVASENQARRGKGSESPLDAMALEQMLSSLPDASVDSAAPPPAASPPLQSWFENMLETVPEAPPAEAAGQSAEIGTDFSARRQVPGTSTRSAAAKAGSTPVTSREGNRPKSVPDLRGPAGEMDSEARRQALRASQGTSQPRPALLSPKERASSTRNTANTPQPSPLTSGDSTVEEAAFAGLLQDSLESQESRRPRAVEAGGGDRTPRQPVNVENHDTAWADEELQNRIRIELQKYPVSAAIPLQIAVHEGTATLIGEVPGDYEKQLVVHFTKMVKGVTQVVDLMRVNQVKVAARSTTAAPPRPVARRKSAGTGAGFSLPFKPKFVGVAAGLLAIIWAGYSFGTRDAHRIKVHPVVGNVQFPGTSLEGALVTLHPASATNSARPKATVKSDGSFEVMTYAPGDGAPEGDYRLTIVLNRMIEVDGEVTATPNLLPPALSKPETTTVNVTVKAGKNEVPPIQIRP